MIFFTLGTGETRHPFTWKSTGDFQIEMKALKPQAEPGDEEGHEEDEDGFFSLLPKESRMSYRFVLDKDYPSITLQSDKYDPQQKPGIGQIELLSLESGPLKDALKKQFAGKY